MHCAGGRVAEGDGASTVVFTTVEMHGNRQTFMPSNTSGPATSWCGRPTFACPSSRSPTTMRFGVEDRVSMATQSPNLGVCPICTVSDCSFSLISSQRVSRDGCISPSCPTLFDLFYGVVAAMAALSGDASLAKPGAISCTALKGRISLAQPVNITEVVGRQIQTKTHSAVRSRACSSSCVNVASSSHTDFMTNCIE